MNRRRSITTIAPGMAANDAAMEALLASVREHLRKLENDAPRQVTDGVPASGSARPLLLAARAVRNALVDHARRKRGVRPGEVLPLEPIAAQFEERAGDLLKLDEALDDLARMNAGVAEVVELRFFGGLACRDVAALLGVSRENVVRPGVAPREPRVTAASCPIRRLPRARSMGHLHVAVAPREFLQHLGQATPPGVVALCPADPAEVVVALVRRSRAVGVHEPTRHERVAHVLRHRVSGSAQRHGATRTTTIAGALGVRPKARPNASKAARGDSLATR